MGKSIFKGWIDDNDPRYRNQRPSVIVGSSFSLAGRPQKVDKPSEKDVAEKTPSEEETKSDTTKSEN